jgi:hypothetical protein
MKQIQRYEPTCQAQTHESLMCAETLSTQCTGDSVCKAGSGLRVILKSVAFPPSACPPAFSCQSICKFWKKSGLQAQASLKPIGCSWSNLTCRLGHWSLLTFCFALVLRGSRPSLTSTGLPACLHVCLSRVSRPTLTCMGMRNRPTGRVVESRRWKLVRLAATSVAPVQKVDLTSSTSSSPAAITTALVSSGGLLPSARLTATTA